MGQEVFQGQLDDHWQEVKPDAGQTIKGVFHPAVRPCLRRPPASHGAHRCPGYLDACRKTRKDETRQTRRGHRRTTRDGDGNDDSEHAGKRRRRPVVQGRGHLRTARQGLHGRQWRRHRRFRGPDQPAGPPGTAGGHGHMAFAVLSLAPARRRLRHRRLPGHPPRLRDAGRIPGLFARRPRPGHEGHHGTGLKPHLGPASLVPGRPQGQTRLGGARFLRLLRDPHPLPRRPDHLQGLRTLQLDLRSRGQGLLLAPVLFPPAGPQFRQSPGEKGDAQDSRFLAVPGRGRLAPGRRAVSLRARRHQLREPARDPRLFARTAGPCGREIPGPDAFGRGQPMARGRGGLFRDRTRRRMQHGLPFPHHAAHLHVADDGGPLPPDRHLRTDPGHPRNLPMGHVFAQPRRADPGDGQRRGARLHVPGLRQGRPGPHQPGHQAQAGPADAEQPTPAGTDQLHPVLLPRHPHHLLRRRDRHGRQLPPGRPGRGTHAHAMEPGQECRVLPGQPPQPVPARGHRPGIPLPGRQRGEPGTQPDLVSVVDAPGHRHAQAPALPGPGKHGLRPARQPQDPVLRAAAGRRGHPGGGQPVPLSPGGRAGSVGLCRIRSCRGLRQHILPYRPRHALCAAHGLSQLFLVPPDPAPGAGPGRQGRTRRGPRAARPQPVDAPRGGTARDRGRHGGAAFPAAVGGTGAPRLPAQAFPRDGGVVACGDGRRPRPARGRRSGVAGFGRHPRQGRVAGDHAPAPDPVPGRGRNPAGRGISRGRGRPEPSGRGTGAPGQRVCRWHGPGSLFFIRGPVAQEPCGP
ncbi:hypothetical protein ASZ90_001762 [hydrocarbon metagenome]|uniref:Uncharacterized protein n=1 Tax=hydrocarbon metagenome TaxID=938273 RepID=A0A0W8G5V1_9ZZZZ